MMDFLHIYLYEVKKGTKPVALVTLEKEKLKEALIRIKDSGFEYFFQKIKHGKVNLFFGKLQYISVLRLIFDKNMEDLNPLQDFVLGILLGYSLETQCCRILNFLPSR